MASTVPAKSQPVHNFSLPHLIWKNHRTGRHRLAGETSSSPSPHRSLSIPLHQSTPSNASRRPSPLLKQSPMRDSESESDPTCAVPIGKTRIVSEKITKSIDDGKRERSNRIRIRLPNNGNVKHYPAVIDENHSSKPVNNKNIVIPSSAADEEEESIPKTWNLRPRRPQMNRKQLNGGLSPLPENRNTHGSYNHNKQASEVKHNDHRIPTTTKKQKFSIALSRDEIEEDIFSLTGLKPSRRPKKRPRSVQKQLDTLFPGLWLGSITADSYKVSEPPLKG